MGKYRPQLSAGAGDPDKLLSLLNIPIAAAFGDGISDENCNFFAPRTPDQKRSLL
jgi:hypothetical protein